MEREWRLKIVESAELEQGGEAHNGMTVAKTRKDDVEERGKTRVKKSA